MSPSGRKLKRCMLTTIFVSSWVCGVLVHGLPLWFLDQSKKEKQKKYKKSEQLSHGNYIIIIMWSLQHK